jgi:hypothetical protein
MGVGGASLAKQAEALMKRKIELLSDPEKHKPPPPPTRKKHPVLTRRALGVKVHSGKGSRRSRDTASRDYYKRTRTRPAA